MSRSNAENVGPGPRPRTVTRADGTVAEVPGDWVLLPPGDATVTRRVKAAGPSWTVQRKKGRKIFSDGVWAPLDVVARVKAEVEELRGTEKYARDRESSKRRRDQAQADYVVEFRRAVLDFLAFPPEHVELARALAAAVTEHATPVGSGTVARTERIPVERRAEAAVIAWMRHQTTAYDNMKIPRRKGARREVRRMLARRCRELLDQYREGESPDPECPLVVALAQSGS